MNGTSLLTSAHLLVKPCGHDVPVCKPVPKPACDHVGRPVCNPICKPVTPLPCKPVAPLPCKPVTPLHCKPVAPSLCKYGHVGKPVCKQLPKIVDQNGVVTITEGCNKVVLSGETVTITGRGPDGCVKQVWSGDVHVYDLLKGTSTSEQNPDVSLSNMNVAGFAPSPTSQLADTIISGVGWYVVYDNATGHIVSESV